MIKNTELTILKVSAQTSMSSLITSITERLRSDHTVIMDSIGEKATYVALKAAIAAKRYLPENQRVAIKPGYVLINTAEGERKAIRWTLELQQM
jgi:stage V sporulation protein SpoVS